VTDVIKLLNLTVKRWADVRKEANKPMYMIVDRIFDNNTSLLKTTNTTHAKRSTRKLAVFNN